MLKELFTLFGSPSFDLIDAHMGFVHLPIGLLWGSVAFDAAACLLAQFFPRQRRLRAAWHSTAYWLLMLGAIAAAVAAALGYFGNPFAGKQDMLAQRAAIHMYFGFATVAIFAILAAWRIALKNQFPRWDAVAYGVLLLAGFVIITATGFLSAHIAG